VRLKSATPVIVSPDQTRVCRPNMWLDSRSSRVIWISCGTPTPRNAARNRYSSSGRPFHRVAENNSRISQCFMGRELVRFDGNFVTEYLI
jgi:hypothetical protein